MDEQRAPPPADRRIVRLAAAQHGVVSRAQLEAAGVARGAIERRLALGRLHRVHRGVYAVGHPLLSRAGRWMAAVLACGPGAVLSHQSAAALWGIRPARHVPIEVTCRSRAGRRPRKGIIVHRTRRLAAGEVTRREAIPVTTPARTLLDLAEVVPRRALERAIDEAERLRLFDLRAVRAVLHSNGGRRGAALLGSVLEEHHIGSTLTRSELEERFLALCRAHNVPVPEVNEPIGPYEVDFLWRAGRLIAETDGRESHGTRAAFEHDRARDARLTVAGYRVVRFTYRQVLREPKVVASVVRSLLRAAG
jgi:hypothetical protein